MLMLLPIGQGSSRRDRYGGVMVVAPGGSRRQPTHTAEDKLARLHALFREPLTGYVIRLLFGDRAAAEDIVQETFTRAWRYLSRHEDGAVAVLRPCLYT